MKGPVRSFVWSVGALGALAALSVGLMSRRLVDQLPLSSSPSTVVVDSYLASRTQGVEISESEYFSQLSSILEGYYVDGVKDKTALATGAVRGMVASLADPNSTFYNKEQMAALGKRLEGRFEGIGAEVTLEFDSAELKKLQEKSKNIDALLLIPVLRVTAVMPKSPAEYSGVEVGDVVSGLDGRAVLSAMDIKRLREMQEKSLKDPSLKGELMKLREEFRKRAENNLPAGKAREKLTTGVEGTLSLDVLREGKTVTLSVKKGETKVPPIIKQEDGSYRVRFFRGLNDSFKSIGLDGKAITLDLRESGQGDFGVLKEFLELTAPAGVYGVLAVDRGAQPKKLSVAKGAAKPASYKLLVDRTTRGAAEVFALALSAKGKAQLSGTAMAGDRSWIDTFAASEGSGYTLTTGTFRPEKGAAK